MKVTITFELELESNISEENKIFIIHKIDECIDQLKCAEIVNKRTLITYPSHVHGFSFNGGRSWGKSHQIEPFIPYLKSLSKHDFEKEYLNNPVEDYEMKIRHQITGFKDDFFVGIDVMQINTFILYKKEGTQLLILRSEQICDDKLFKNKVQEIAESYHCNIIGDSYSMAKFADY